VDGQALRFGTTGNLRRSDLVMWSDDPGETWWQQITGEALVGNLVGRRLTMLPAQIASFADFQAAYPNGQVLSRDTGHPRGYGTNPYVGYDDINSSPFLYSGPKDGRAAGSCSSRCRRAASRPPPSASPAWPSAPSAARSPRPRELQRVPAHR
jgi:hypothetical protein